jgi:hypothetical protein
MRRLVSNIEVRVADNGELVAESNFVLAELAIQARREMHGGSAARPISFGVSAAS